MKRYIKNFDELAVTKERTDMLSIIESAYKAIDTTEIINDNFKLREDVLTIKDKTFYLKDYKRIFVIGFGKASLVQDLQQKKAALDIIMAHYSNGTYEYPENVMNALSVIKVRIESITGKKLGYE